METIESIIHLLTVERDKLNVAIEALNGPRNETSVPPKKAAAEPKPSRPPVTTTSTERPKRRTLSAAGRKAIGEAAKRRWAAIKAGKAPSPFAAHRKAEAK